MGVDIHMNIINNKGEYLAKNIFDGRNSEWFDNICNEGYDVEYDYFPAKNGFPDKIPEDMHELEDWCYGFRYISTYDFRRWYRDYNPAFHGGFVTKYTAWMLKQKHIIPDFGEVHQSKKSLCKEYNIFPDECEWVEYLDPHDCSRWLMNYLCNNGIPFTEDTYICYCFDR